MMINLHDVITLAIGEQEARKVDTTIPQYVFDKLTAPEAANVAGWYYDDDHRIFGRLLTRSECWQRITEKVQKDSLVIQMMGFDITHMAKDWGCLRAHAERGELLIIEKPAKGGA